MVSPVCKEDSGGSRFASEVPESPVSPMRSAQNVRSFAGIGRVAVTRARPTPPPPSPPAATWTWSS